MADFSADAVARAIVEFGNYRTRRCQYVALQGQPDGIFGITLMALGLRESALRNINGGAELVNGKWVATKTDKGVFQIASLYHAYSLARMPAVQEGTWAPVVAPGVTGDDLCPRFEDSIQFTLRQMHEAQAFGADHDVPVRELPRFAVAAHNAGVGGALKGYREGNVDKYTAHGDYSAWVERHARKIQAWLVAHPGWRVTHL